MFLTDYAALGQHRDFDSEGMVLMQGRKGPKRREERPYIYERVVTQHRQKQVRNLITLIACAVVFGCIAGGCLILMMRFKPKESAVISVTQERNGQETRQSEVSAQDNSPLGAYELVKDSFVTVVTVYGTGDWIDDEPTVRGTAETFGVIVAENSEEYYVLTAADMVENAELIYMKAGSYVMDAEVEVRNRADNIAVLSVLKEDIPEDICCKVAVLGSSLSLKQGDMVIAAGSPYAFPGSANYGHVTYVGTEEVYDCSRTMIYTDMSASSECYGVLLDQDGGIAAWIIESDEDGVSELICGAVIDELHEEISRMVDGKPVAWLGVTGQEVIPAISENHGIPDGFYITRIAEDSPAKLAGLQRGDFVHTVDGEQVRNSTQLGKLLAEMEAGDSVSIELMRMVQDGYETMTVEAVLGER